MSQLVTDGIGLHWHAQGDPEGRPVLFLNSLGTDLRLWDGVVAALPQDLYLVRMDTRGHGQSDVPPDPYDLPTLTNDALALAHHLDLRDLTVVGVSLGGMMAQSLALARPERVSGLVLSNTAMAMGTPQMWADRMAAIRAGGLAAMADAVLDRWFGADFRHSPEIGFWRDMLLQTPQTGYLGCCAALAGADLGSVSPGLRHPSLVVAGSDDGASPPELVKTLADAIPGAGYVELPGIGHLPMAEAPQRFASLLVDFMKETAP